MDSLRKRMSEWIDSARLPSVREITSEPGSHIEVTRVRRPWLTADHWVPILEDRIAEALSEKLDFVTIRVEHAADLVEVLRKR